MLLARREKTGFVSGSSFPWPALVAGLLWLLAGLSAGYWILQAWGRSAPTPVAGAAPQGVVSDMASMARVLGALPPAQEAAAVVPAAASRYNLLGVADLSGPSGSALIAMDGQPPRPYRVGATVEGGLVLQSVDRRSARLGATQDGPATVELTLPEVPAAN